jgi:phospholipase/carboxylesterase
MPAVNNSFVYYHQGTIFRSNLSLGQQASKVCLLLHGWNGDENSMQIFFSNLPEDMGIIAPRAFYPTNENGYTWASSMTSWSIIQSNQRSPLDELNDSAEILVNHLYSWLKFLTIDPSTLYVAGFSQGGAMALLLGLLYPLMFSRIACLSGFLPAGIENGLPDQIIKSRKILVTHGTQDEIIPVEKARDSVSRLSVLGFDVEYCEDNIGHKIGIGCRKKFGKFFG